MQFSDQLESTFNAPFWMRNEQSGRLCVGLGVILYFHFFLWYRFVGVGRQFDALRKGRSLGSAAE